MSINRLLSDSCKCSNLSRWLYFHLESCMMLSFPQWRFPRVFQISGWVWVCAPGSHKQMVISLITMPHVIDYLILCHISLYHMSLSHIYIYIYHTYILISKCYDYIIYITDTHVLQAFPGCTSGYQPLNCFFFRWITGPRSPVST